MPKPLKNTGLNRLVNAFFFSLDGIKSCMKSEEAFRQEVYVSIILIPLGFYLGGGAIEKILLVGSILFLFIVELLNTAIEKTIDRISLEHSTLSKNAKDMGSAAVLFAILLAILVWVMILTQ